MAFGQYEADSRRHTVKRLGFLPANSRVAVKNSRSHYPLLLDLVQIFLNGTRWLGFETIYLIVARVYSSHFSLGA